MPDDIWKTVTCSIEHAWTEYETNAPDPIGAINSFVGHTKDSGLIHPEHPRISEGTVTIEPFSPEEHARQERYQQHVSPNGQSPSKVVLRACAYLEQLPVVPKPKNPPLRYTRS